MIYTHGGKLGVGKTYSCTLEIWQWLNKGTDVYCNWKIDFTPYLKKIERNPISKWLRRKKKYGNLFYFSKLSDIYGISNGQIYIDEAHNLVRARDYANTPPDFITKMSQSRHYHTDLHFICQYPGQIESVVRNLTQTYIKHTKFWRFMWHKEYDGEFIDLVNKPEQKVKAKYGGFTWFKKSFSKVYNTYEKVGHDFKPWSYPPVWNKQIYLQNLIDLKLKELSERSFNGYFIREVKKTTGNIKITIRSLSPTFPQRLRLLLRKIRD